MPIMAEFGSIVILTGAGISAESGVKTFRDHGGLWENHRIEDVATPGAFRRNPELVQSFYNARRAQLSDPQLKPNAAHLALVELERNWPGEFLLVTQNVDNLHDRAGSKNLIHMHGELAKVRCLQTGKVFDWLEPIFPDTKCACCGQERTLRPHIVWFEEMPFEMERIFDALADCEIFAAIGTSGQVYPAAGFVNEVPHWARTVEINADASAVSTSFREFYRGPATQEVPRFVRELLESVGR
jgi:NAD-dependent deacetylase